MSAKSLAAYLGLFTALILAVFASTALAQGALYEGARLITGDGSAIEDSSFLVEGDQFTRIGRKGEVALPDGSARIDLTGKSRSRRWPRQNSNRFQPPRQERDRRLRSSTGL
jgi:hypothetical protein